MAKKSKLKPEISEKEENINADKNNIFNPGGELVVDVFETNSDFVVFAAIAGVSIKDLDISVEKEMMVIKGQRQDPHLDHVRQYFYQECYFGPFKRTIVLPENIDTDLADAQMDKGMLTIKIPKIDKLKELKPEIKVS
ncbi:MAG: Protein containing Heat shock protein Hsp20 protein [Parcubacteria group bacterium GW2011_GWA2_33_14]|uniref:SHSP domain-containing protein n=1 Tax=Candidatus Staskawiczbacteria bacterium RIFCSPHIGHO2_02_FULL_33_16 TaxID=1802204 RepID=A0A1G2HXI4_9BACT|nr:MAG: Protein containing Heat shock protein Hsp20 protein [Parcubacteria group bacterium GW2011_GWA2_33_14]OGZ67232.1 MAG: hypothetical protein A3D34_00400 [Candidatus Staskawiczbacteria bacterium RIFCSPHIGHO2_02_FULL_33_16]OGZ70921.1 MAG: hypothetical protein A2980_02790 [Candidatus Staskawiczbacteria bacterium RIFCSPLOWO2_01_FULL_33_13]